MENGTTLCSFSSIAVVTQRSKWMEKIQPRWTNSTAEVVPIPHQHKYGTGWWGATPQLVWIARPVQWSVLSHSFWVVVSVGGPSVAVGAQEYSKGGAYWWNVVKNTGKPTTNHSELMKKDEKSIKKIAKKLKIPFSDNITHKTVDFSKNKLVEKIMNEASAAATLVGGWIGLSKETLKNLRKLQKNWRLILTKW